MAKPRFLDGGPHGAGTAATSSSRRSSTCCALDMAEIESRTPAVAAHVLGNLARRLSLRLRTTTDNLRRLEDTLG